MRERGRDRDSTGCGITSLTIPNSYFQRGARRARERSKVLGALRARSVESPSNLLLLDAGGSAAVAKLAARMPRERSKLAQSWEEENTALWCAEKWKCCSHSHVNGAILADTCKKSIHGTVGGPL